MPSESLNMEQAPVRSLPRYQYEPLKGPRWIRVIQLQAAVEFEDRLVCRIIHLERPWHALSTDPIRNHYYPVSYASGEPEFSSHVICQADTGESEESIFWITPNVEGMLRHFRKPHKVLNLWIDAICLNQNDKREIQEQLSQMGAIFAQGKRTRIWLGDQGQGSQEVLAYCRLAALMESGRKLAIQASIDEERLKTSAINLNLKSNIVRFSERPWFSRRWILQELSFSRIATIYCGSSSISWTHLALAFKHMMKATGDDLSTLYDQGILSEVALDDRISRTLQLLELRDSTPPSLLDMLWRYHYTECSDMRDRVFALAGFCDRSFFYSGDIIYDQAAALTFRDVAATFIDAGHLPEILAHSDAFGNVSEVTESVPSWVPNWCSSRKDELVDHTHYEWLRLVRRREKIWPVRYDIADTTWEWDAVCTIQQAVTVTSCFVLTSPPTSLKDILASLRDFLFPDFPQFLSTQCVAQAAITVLHRCEDWRRRWSDWSQKFIEKSRYEVGEDLLKPIPNDEAFLTSTIKAWTDVLTKDQLFCCEAFRDADISVLPIGFGPIGISPGDFMLILQLEKYHYDFVFEVGQVHLFKGVKNRTTAPPTTLVLGGKRYQARALLGQYLGIFSAHACQIHVWPNDRELQFRCYYRELEHGAPPGAGNPAELFTNPERLPEADEETLLSNITII